MEPFVDEHVIRGETYLCSNGRVQPTPLWTRATHLFYPLSFQYRTKLVLLCHQRRDGNFLSRLPKQLVEVVIRWLAVLSYGEPLVQDWEEEWYKKDLARLHQARIDNEVY
eukprot:GILK01003070.1.p2 GENE.GILK01003070.1~~GILK01003070.1.p2  ORF type:complete len:110 (+),score=17.29 GILK01003070.1:257-586(+)